MTLPEYLSDVAKRMQAESTSIRRDFASHRPSAGENRESVVGEFLRQHLPQRFHVASGIVISCEGAFSNEADLIVVDALDNAPLYGGSPSELWPVEAVFALIEVKTALTPSQLSDAIAKGRRFKSLRREFCDLSPGQLVRDSLFVIWGFECPDPEVFRRNLQSALADCPVAEQPDLIVVPDKVVARAGSYLEFATLGQPGSPFRAQLQAQHGPNLRAILIPDGLLLDDMGENALMAWYLYFDSWLRRSGTRLSSPNAYLPLDRVYGRALR
jgi:hypothetical protein